MQQPQKKDDYSGFAIIILFALFGKAFYDFKSLGLIILYWQKLFI